MNIKVVGTGDMWTKHNSASYVIDEKILVDIPNGSCKNLLNLEISPEKINNVLITHFHGDHYFDIPFLFLLKSQKNSINLNIYCDRKGKNKINKLFKLAFPNTVKKVNDKLNINYNFADEFIIEKYKINKILVDHGNMKPAYGYIVENNNINVGFTGDTNLNDNVEYMASICKYLFCDCALIEGSNKHMGIDNIKYLANRYKNCTFVVSHMNDNTRNELKRLKTKNIIVPYDGEMFSV